MSRLLEKRLFVTSRHGFLTSVPGDPEVRMECLLDSTLPAELRKLGDAVSEICETERILAAAIEERFTRRADGELEPLTEGSTKPIATDRLHGEISLTELDQVSGGSASETVARVARVLFLAQGAVIAPAIFGTALISAAMVFAINRAGSGR